MPVITGDSWLNPHLHYRLSYLTRAIDNSVSVAAAAEGEGGGKMMSTRDRQAPGRVSNSRSLVRSHVAASARLSTHTLVSA